MHRQKYKTLNTESREKNRITRAKEYTESRKDHRARAFNDNRNLSNSAINTQEAQIDPAVQDRLTRLTKWKAEREKRKRIEQRKKKQPFVVGVVHHKIYSPAATINMTTTSNVSSKPIVKKISKATEKRLMYKATQKNLSAENSNKSSDKLNKNQEKKEQSFAPEGHIFKAPAGLPNIPLFGRLNIRSMSPDSVQQFLHPPLKMTRSRSSTIKNNSTEFIKKETYSPVTETNDNSVESTSLKLFKDSETTNSINTNSSNDNEVMMKNKIHNSTRKTSSSSDNNKSMSIQSNSPCEPAFFSPHIVSSRGKSNARKEQQLKKGLIRVHSLSDDIPTKETVMKNLNISIEEEEHTAQYFHFLLNKEINRLNELCEKWMEIKRQSDTTEDGQYEINQAIGQTNLLINKKFERFRGLVNDCETGKGKMLVTCKDLQGFWDMMYMEVENCNLRFEKLEKLRVQGWKEEELFINKPVTKKKISKKKVVSTKSSSIRAFLVEKKKKMKNDDDMKEFKPNLNHSVNNKCDRNESSNIKQNKIKSRSLNCNENKFVKNNRLSLLQKIQLSDTSKKTRSPLTLIKISQMCKTPKIQLDNSISYINSNKTPGKSILKQQKNSNETECVKSANKINFNEHVILNEVSTDEETQTKVDLTLLSRIDNFDFDSTDEVKINVEKKLNFDDSSCKENEDDTKKSLENKNSTNENICKTVSIQIQNSNKSLRRITRQNAIDSMLDQTLPLNTSTSVSLKKDTSDIDLNILNDKLQKQSISSTEETDEQNETTRILRNRTIISTDTPRLKRRSSRKMSVNVQEIEHKETETPIDKRKRRSRFKLNTNERNDIELLCHNCDDISLDKSKNKRKSTRSVKFSEKEYSDGTNKPTLPLTPHVKSKSRSRSNSICVEIPTLEIQEK
ncbi:unnamed protein product, partial [Heterotrigona itama]